MRNKAWSVIGEYAKSIGALPSGKDTLYIRDVWWPNVRKTSMEKRDNARKTGTGGGYDAKTNDVDMLVYDILGKESPVLEGLSVPESMDELAEKQFYEHNEQPSRSTISSELVIAKGSGTTRKDSITQPRSKKRKNRTFCFK
ncbi:uncharacterized protein LOC134203873 [Armigeres subalbatus]|uniref:uncharacterized protein LOC134203873 n=1 Tax=Armigeres subalbatus TaxID=124917 RepID=UPI002ED1EF97